MQDLIDNEKLSRIKAVEKIWNSIIEYFEYFKEWFQNRTLYHYVGLLIAIKGNNIIESTVQRAKQFSKSKFKEYLEREIAMVIKNKKPIDKLVYEDENGRKTDYQDIIKILLLHNVHTTLRSSKENPRFPFELYKEQNWSLEHIYARNSQSLTDTAKQKEWLSDHIKSLSSSNIEGSYNKLISKMEGMRRQNEIDNATFEDIEEEVYESIEKSFEFGSDENIHLIKNLCLLDKATNSQLNNSVFDVKREKIKKRELTGFYIPVCSKNVFLKTYTVYPTTNAYWTKSDRNDYLSG